MMGVAVCCTLVDTLDVSDKFYGDAGPVQNATLWMIDIG